MDDGQREIDRLQGLLGALLTYETRQHTDRVGHVAAMIAKRIGLREDEVAVIRRAAPLHDIGKLAISDGILLKPGRLTAGERVQVETHTTIGAQILAGSHSRVLRMGKVIAVGHHERWDGGGYPDHMAGYAIPVSARLTAIADVFDALTHTRPYKQVWPVDDAVAEIARLSGSHFDPGLVDAFMSLDHRQLLFTP
jgi:putative two-component system response regulator